MTYPLETTDRFYSDDYYIADVVSEAERYEGYGYTVTMRYGYDLETIRHGHASGHYIELVLTSPETV